MVSKLQGMEELLMNHDRARSELGGLPTHSAGSDAADAGSEFPRPWSHMNATFGTLPPNFKS